MAAASRSTSDARQVDRGHGQQTLATSNTSHASVHPRAADQTRISARGNPRNRATALRIVVVRRLGLSAIGYRLNFYPSSGLPPASARSAHPSVSGPRARFREACDA